MGNKLYDTEVFDNQVVKVEKNIAFERRWWILVAVSMGAFMTNLDNGVTSVALSTLSSVFNVSIDLIQWVMSGYLLTICALLPILGKLSDLLGRGRLLNLGFLLFAVGSALSAISTSFAILVLAKVVQGIGSSMILANTMGILVITFPENQRGKAIGIVGVAVSLGAMSGPVFGGLLLEYFGWSSIFWFNVPIGLLGLAIGLWVLPKKRTEKPTESFDYLGSALFAIGIFILMYTVSGIESRGFSSSMTIIGLLISAVVLGLFYIWEKRTPYPMLDFSLYRIRLFLTGSLAAYLSSVSLIAVNVMMPFFLQDVMHYSPGTTGYVMAAYPSTMLLAAPLAGWLSDRIGSYWLTAGGLVLNALGFVSLTLLSPEVNLWVVVVLLSIFGVGHGMFTPSNNSSLMGAVPRSKVGLAGGLNALTRNFGMVTGLSFSVSLFTYKLRTHDGQTGSIDHGSVPTEVFLSALHSVFWAAALICTIGAIISLFRGKPQIG